MDSDDGRIESAVGGTHPIEKRFMGVADATAYTDLSKESIRRLVAAGKLTAFRPIRGRVLLDRRELDALILSSTARPRKGRGRNSQS